MPDDPDWMAPVSDASPDTVHGIIRRLGRSCSKEHLVYREAELDDLWRHARMEARRPAPEPRTDGNPEPYYVRLERMVFEAHDLTAAGHTREAADVLTEAIKDAPGGKAPS